MIKRIIRNRHLTKEEVEKYSLIRQQIKEELPKIFERHRKRMGVDIGSKLAIGIKYNFNDQKIKEKTVRFDQYTGEKKEIEIEDTNYLYEDKLYEDIYEIIAIIKEKTKLDIFNIHTDGFNDNFWHIGLNINYIDAKHPSKCFSIEEKNLTANFETVKQLLEKAGFSNFELKLFHFINFN